MIYMCIDCKIAKNIYNNIIIAGHLINKIKTLASDHSLVVKLTKISSQPIRIDEPRRVSFRAAMHTTGDWGLYTILCYLGPLCMLRETEADTQYSGV